jgi:endonuclease G, mitochondrial
MAAAQVLLEQSPFDILREKLAAAPEGAADAVAGAPDGSIVLTHDEALSLLDAEAGGPIAIDPNYDDREGFDESFLGVPVPLPMLGDDLTADVVTYTDAHGQEQHVLRYHHYSVVMSHSRKFAFVTAVNIDGHRRFSIDRDADRWAFDPRIPKDLQVGPPIYARNDLDRGHLVRRQDPDWGAGLQEAKQANDDTFHFTNCTPQHKDFNRNPQTWHGLEDYILNNASSNQLRVCVFNAPVLAADDPPYRGIQIPRRFWKVVVTRTEDGSLHSSAYMLTQADLVVSLEEEFEFGPYKTFQVPIETIETASNLDFGNLRDADRFPPGLEEDVEPQIELESLADVRL